MWRVKHHEFWNTHIFHLPIYLYWLFLSLKAKSFFFFSAANPSIETGGLLGESKYKILQKINPAFLPLTLYFEEVRDIARALATIHEAHISFPFIVKPDVGQGGWLIDLIHTETEFRNFVAKIKMPFIVQEYVDEPLELGVLYYRYPGSGRGTISSLSIKEMLTVTGDGRNSIRTLMRGDRRAMTQLLRLQQNNKVDLDSIPVRGEIVKLSFIANHSYGTMFKNSNHLITPELTSCFDNLCNSIDGFYFGRFDIRCKSMEALIAGDFKILELNGVGSEPLHIFDPAENIFSAYKEAFKHWRVIYEIGMLNRKSRTNFMNVSQAWEAYRNMLRLQRIHATRMTIGN
jgi:hypothetical protein